MPRNILRGYGNLLLNLREAPFFRITIFDTRTRGDNWKPQLERVVVAGE